MVGSPLNCLSAGQLRYTVSWLVVILLLPVLLPSASFVGEWDGELREAGWKHDDDDDELMLNVLRCQLTY